jgi:hypothetical protein
MGEAAVRILLKWPSGVFEAWQGPWPQNESIALSWQNLLLRAAQAEDEENRKPKVVSLRKDIGSMEGNVPVEQDKDGDGPTIVRLSSNGEFIAGNAPPEFGEGVAYAVTVADVLGDLLGIERTTAIEYTLSQSACIIVRDGKGEMSAAAGRGLDIASLKMLASAR